METLFRIVQEVGDAVMSAERPEWASRSKDLERLQKFLVEVATNFLHLDQFSLAENGVGPKLSATSARKIARKVLLLYTPITLKVLKEMKGCLVGIARPFLSDITVKVASPGVRAAFDFRNLSAKLVP